MADTQVLIVGAGPVGLTLAVDLGKRGIRCTLIEQKEAPAFLPKMERCNARTMELYRRMGISERVRAAGLPRNNPMDVFIVLSLVEPPLWRLPFPSVVEAEKEIAASPDASMPLEPYQLISQYTLEPLLKSIAEELPSIAVRYGHALESFTDHGGSVTGHIKRLDGTTLDITADYLVACDGGGSGVRKQLDIRLAGDANLQQFRQALYRIDDFYDRIPIGKGRHYHVADGALSFLITQDSTRHFTLHAILDNEAEMDAKLEEVVAMPIKYERLSCAPWRQNLLVADSYQRGRVFLAGDAVHLVIPTGGLGMNTGVGDAVDLGWKLAATLNGWGGPNLLASYEIERRQVGERNVAASRFAAGGRRKWRGMYRPNIRDKTPEGDKTRADLIAVAEVEQRKSNEMIGAELGYRYVDSPLIAAEPGEGPPHDFMTYVPSTWPGARLPHVWLNDHTAVQDRIGYGDHYTLLRLDGRDDAAGFDKAFAAVGAPFRLLALNDAHAREIYGHGLMLLRPDMHIAWRGDAPPADTAKLARMATGH
jgi:2-polyprenyl-6-methoxyphenol hydroxylase-like FAD-dependent oxidoreductase